MPIKESAGIILCRKSTKGYEVLIVHKRASYAFSYFVNGKYSSLNRAKALLSNMSREELIAIMYLDFDALWYRMWLSYGSGDYYEKCRAKFHNTFIEKDGGKTLQDIIKKTRPLGDHIWELPKGRRLSPKLNGGKEEPMISCAMRELSEEAKIERNEYKIIPNITCNDRFVSEGVEYRYTFFAAIANNRLAGGSRDESLLNPFVREGEGEVCEVKWVNLNDLKYYDGPEQRIKKLVSPIFNKLKNIESQ